MHKEHADSERRHWHTIHAVCEHGTILRYVLQRMGRLADLVNRHRCSLHTVVIWGAACSLLAVAGCSSDSEPPQVERLHDADISEFHTAAQMRAEFDRATEDIDVPEGFIFRTYAIDGIEDDTLFEPGYGTGRVFAAALCAWENEVLLQRDVSPAQSEAALEHFETMLDDPIFLKMFDQESARPWFQNMLDGAKLGDYAAMQRDVTQNCPVFLDANYDPESQRVPQ